MEIKFSKYLMPSLALLALTLGACSDDDEAIVGPQSQGAFFPNNSKPNYYVELADTEAAISMMRTNTEQAQTINLTVEDESGLFSIPSQVSFAAGQEGIEIPITFDATKLEPKDYEVMVTIDPEQAYTYGMTQYKFNIGLDNSYRWNTIGKCQYNDAFRFDEYYECDMQQHVLNTNQFRVVAPYAQAIADQGADYPTSAADPASEYVTITLLSPGMTAYGVKVTSTGLVSYDDICTGYYMSNYDAVIYALFPGRLTSLQNEAAWAYNKVMSYQDNGLPNAVQLAPYYYMFGVGGWNYTTSSDAIHIIFPGGRLTDSSAEVSDVTCVVDEQTGVATVTAHVTIGPDATSARVAVVEGNDAESANFLITHDRAEYQTLTQSGDVTFTMSADAEPGTYMVVASSYIDSKPSEYGYETFELVVPVDESWSYVATGTYTYAQLFEGDDPGLELYVCDQNPELYKITHWGYDVDFYFTWADDGSVVVGDQYIGYDHPSYGQVWVDDMVDFYETDANGVSFFKNMVFNFNVVYYCSQGVFGRGYETFTITGTTQGAAVGMAKAPRYRAILPEWENISARNLKMNAPIDKNLVLGGEF